MHFGEEDLKGLKQTLVDQLRGCYSGPGEDGLDVGQGRGHHGKDGIDQFHKLYKGAYTVSSNQMLVCNNTETFFFSFTHQLYMLLH